MFWKISFRQPLAIDALLDKEDCTLGEILDEDDVLQECKSNNKKLTDFLARPDILQQLVNLICFEADNDAMDKVKFKYPHLACELLTSEVFTIVEQLSTSNHLLAMLWQFLDSPTPLNPLLASFISKVLAMLLSKEPNVIVSFIKQKEDFMTKFVNHLGTSAIMDLLLQMVATPPTDEVRIELAVWLKEENIVQRLVDLIKDQEEQDDPDQCVNASNTLCEMIRISREAYQISNPTPLHEVLESRENIDRLLGNMFSSETPSDVVIIYGVSILLTILRDTVPYMESGIAPLVPDPSPLSEMPPSPGIANVMEMVVPYLKQFHTLLNRKPEISMQTTVGVLDPPLGNMRLTVVKLISALLSRTSSALAQEIVKLDIFNSILALFFSFPWNNFLHMQVELCIKYVLESSSFQLGVETNQFRGEEGEGGNKEEDVAESSFELRAKDLKSLKSHLLKDCQFVSKLLDGASTNEAKKAVRRLGYMGHLVRISNSLVKFGEVDEQLKFSLDESTQQRWNNYVNGPLAEMNKRNETNLGGNQPLNSNMDDSDDEFDQLGSPGGDSELEKAYQQYLDVKYSGSYLEEYGVEDELSATEEPFEASFTRLMDITRMVSVDEEKTNSLFEAVCSDRIQQFDDEEEISEEEDNGLSMWADKDANLSSPMDHRSASSDEDEFISSRREFSTGESYDTSQHNNQVLKGDLLSSSPNIITQVTSATSTSNDPDKMEIGNSFGVISWKSDISSDEDLSGVIPMDTGTAASDWTKEPEETGEGADQSPGWADFSKFSDSVGANVIRSTQSLEDEPSVTPSHITVTYITRDLQNASIDDDEDFLEPSERPNSSKYSLLSPDGNQKRDLDPENVEVTFEGRTSDSDDDINSSDSDEERTGNYSIFNSSDGEILINSLDSSREQEVATSPSSPYSTANASPSQAPPLTTPTSSEHDHQSPTTSPNGKPHPSGEDNVRHNTVGVDDQKLPVDGEPLDGELQDNFIFLSKKGMLSSDNNSQEIVEGNQSLVEQKRTEALEAAANYDKETRDSVQQDSIET